MNKRSKRLSPTEVSNPNPFEERNRRVERLSAGADENDAIKVLIFQNAGESNPDRQSVALIKKQLETNLNWIEKKFLSSDTAMRVAAVGALLELSAIIVTKLDQFIQEDSNAVMIRARDVPAWPVFLSNDTISLRRCKKLIADLQVGKFAADVVNRRKLESRKSVAKNVAALAAEIIQAARKVGHHRITYKNRGVEQPLPKETQRYLHLDEDSMTNNIQEEELKLTKLLNDLAIFIDAPNPFVELEHFQRYVHACETLPDLNSNTVPQWATATKDILLAYTAAPETLPILRVLGEHRARHYQNKEGDTPEKTRERNIQVRIFERLDEALLTISKRI